MAGGKLYEYYIYRKIIKVLLLSCGIYPLKNPSFVYRIIPYIHLLLMTMKIVGTVGFVRVHLTNVIVVSKRFSIMVSQITIVLEFICMIVYRGEIELLQETLDKYFDILISDRQLTKKVSYGGAVFWRLSWVVSILVLTAGVLNIIMPIMVMMNQHKYHIYPIKYFLPNGSIYPWNVTPGGLLWKFHYLCESLSVYTLVAVTSSVIPLFSLYVFQIIGRLREMSHRMLHLDESINLEIIVRNCISQYGTLLNCRLIIQKIFGPMIFWMVLTNAIILCQVMLQLSQVKTMGTGQLIFFSAYVITKLVQTFLFGYTGSRLTAESEDYRNAIYAVNWHGNKWLISVIIMMLTQKPLTIKAAKFFTISVDMFISVINTTMSYYFLLQTLQQ